MSKAFALSLCAIYVFILWLMFWFVISGNYLIVVYGEWRLLTLLLPPVLDKPFVVLFALLLALVPIALDAYSLYYKDPGTNINMLHPYDHPDVYGVVRLRRYAVIPLFYIQIVFFLRIFISHDSDPKDSVLPLLLTLTFIFPFLFILSRRPLHFSCTCLPCQE